MVSFQNAPKVCLIPRISNDDKQRVWYSSRDYREFRAEILRIAQQVKTNVPQEERPGDVEIRGLENWSMDNFHIRRKTIREIRRHPEQSRYKPPHWHDKPEAQRKSLARMWPEVRVPHRNRALTAQKKARLVGALAQTPRAANT